jgi:hypothetical protein
MFITYDFGYINVVYLLSVESIKFLTLGLDKSVRIGPENGVNLRKHRLNNNLRFRLKMA